MKVMITGCPKMAAAPADHHRPPARRAYLRHAEWDAARAHTNNALIAYAWAETANGAGRAVGRCLQERQRPLTGWAATAGKWR
jgi:hypothetical protein